MDPVMLFIMLSLMVEGIVIAWIYHRMGQIRVELRKNN